VTAVASALKRTPADKLTCKAVVCRGLRQPSGGGLADLEVAVSSPPATALRLLIGARSATAVRNAVALLEPSGSLEVALGWLWGGFRVALGWLWGRNPLAINTLWGGSAVALGGFARIVEVRGSRFRVRRWMFAVRCWMLDVICVNLCLSVVPLGLYCFSQSSRNSPHASTSSKTSFFLTC
jgi:hypothetical protein